MIPSIAWFIFLSLIAIAVGIFYYLQNNKIKRLLQGEIERKAVESELMHLKNQLNPHFLFNSFNTLIALIEEDPTKAVAFTEDLTDFYRLILEQSKAELIPYSEEIQIVEIYCDILNERFGHSLNLYIQNKNMPTLIPPLTIQLLIENVVKHNELTSKKKLNVDIYFDGNYIIVANDKRPKLSKPISTKQGIANIKKRYELLCHQQILINNWDHRFEVKLPVIHTSSLSFKTASKAPDTMHAS